MIHQWFRTQPPTMRLAHDRTPEPHARLRCSAHPAHGEASMNGPEANKSANAHGAAGQDHTERHVSRRSLVAVAVVVLVITVIVAASGIIERKRASAELAHY